MCDFVDEETRIVVVTEQELSRKQAECDKKAIEDLVRERDILNKVP